MFALQNTRLLMCIIRTEYWSYWWTICLTGHSNTNCSCLICHSRTRVWTWAEGPATTVARIMEWVALDIQIEMALWGSDITGWNGCNKNQNVIWKRKRIKLYQSTTYAIKPKTKNIGRRWHCTTYCKNYNNNDMDKKARVQIIHIKPYNYLHNWVKHLIMTEQ